MPEEFYQTALHCSGVACFGRKSFVFEKNSMFVVTLFIFKVGLGILEITSAKRSPQVWPQNYRSLYTTKVFDFASYLCSNKHRES